MAGNSFTGYEDYSKVANSYDSLRVSFGLEIILGALARYATGKSLSSLNILELGCGTGNFTQDLCKYVGHVTAVDNSDEMLDMNRSKMAGVGNVTIKNVDLRKSLPFEPDTFDAVLLIYVIHHLDEVKPNGENNGQYFKGVMKDSNRVLKNGAPLIICTFGREQIKHCVWYFHFAHENGFPDILQAHIDRFLPFDALSSICEEAGFKTGPRTVTLNEKLMNNASYYDVNNVYRPELSSWRDIEKHQNFPKFLEAHKRAVESKEVDKWIKESDEIRSRQGMSTFLTFYKQ